MRWGIVGAVRLTSAACEGATQLLVIVDSDLSGVASVEATASSTDLSAIQAFDVSETGLPFSFGVHRVLEEPGFWAAIGGGVLAVAAGVLLAVLVSEHEPSVNGGSSGRVLTLDPMGPSIP